MPRYFTKELLYDLRNHIPMDWLVEQLDWPHKRRDGQFAFLCPSCREFVSATNPRTNLGRCFCCNTNFNPIDFIIAVHECDFVEAVHFLKPMLDEHRDH